MNIKPLLLIGRKSQTLKFFKGLKKHSSIPIKVLDTRRVYPQLINRRCRTKLNLRAALKCHIEYRQRQRSLRARIPGIKWLYAIMLDVRARLCFITYLNIFKSGCYGAVGLWNGLKYPECIIKLAAREAGLKILHFELGSLPNTLTIDDNGINYLNSVPRDSGYYNRLHFAAEYAEKAIIPRAPIKPNKIKAITLPERYLFAPFQVNRDSQVIVFSPWVRDMRMFYELLRMLQQDIDREALDLKIVIKEHPSCENEYADLHARAQDDGIIFANANDTPSLIKNARAIITLNSSAGLEALMLSKPVIVLGQAFYNIEGLTMQAHNYPQLWETVRRLDKARTDPRLRENFLHYLEKEYFVRRFKTLGSDRSVWPADAEHDWHAHEKRIVQLLAGEVV
ncbi:MAG: hypothetical protein MJA83_09755 [Gammaproteobacteria bacterium]|nr:hypothetical protein [Gammaproteobacteria bacterium]